MSNTRVLALALTTVVLSAGGAAALEFEEQIVGDAMPGWETKDGRQDAWTIADGVLTCTGKDVSKGWIGTKAHHTDFVIEFEFKLPPGGNSGVFLRTPNVEYSPANDLEIQILDDYADKHKNLEPGQYCGSIYKFCPPAKRVSNPAGEWNRMRVTAVQQCIQVILNDVVIVDTEKCEHAELADRSPRGAIGFQNYGDKVQFRRIKLADIAKDREARSRWFRDAKFGMFIHWGIYAVRGEGEWIMNVAKVPAAEYEKLAPRFSPVKFNAAEWVGLAKRAGQKYMVITSKHHDGFAMFATEAGPYNIIDATPYKRDPMKDLAAECAKQGIRFGFYHSIMDWHHPHFTAAPEWDLEARQDYVPIFLKYMDYMQAQLRELCTNYGPICMLWYDGGWRGQFPAHRTRMREINAMVRELQPQILINNRSVMPEDFMTPEQFVPPTGVLGPDGRPMLWENCITLTDTRGWWGYDKDETKFKSSEYVIRTLADIVSKGGNLLLNVGPSPEGTIGPNETRTLEETGRWLDKYGEAIYGTTASPFRYLPFHGRCTVKGNTLYTIVFTWPSDRRIVLPGIKNEIRGVRLLGEDDSKTSAVRRENGVIVSLPDQAPDAVASVVAIDLEGPPAIEPFAIEPGPEGSIALPIVFGDLRGRHGQRMRLESADGEVHAGNWINQNDFITWEFTSAQPGKYEVGVVYAADKKSEGGTFEVVVGSTEAATSAPAGANTQQEIATAMIDKLAEKGSSCEGAVTATGGATAFETRRVGTLTLPAGKCLLAIRAKKINKDTILMNLKRVELKPLDAGR